MAAACERCVFPPKNTALRSHPGALMVTRKTSPPGVIRIPIKLHGCLLVLGSRAFRHKDSVDMIRLPNAHIREPRWRVSRNRLLQMHL